MQRTRTDLARASRLFSALWLYQIIATDQKTICFSLRKAGGTLIGQDAKTQP
jgi:hypothetical protein